MQFSPLFCYLVPVRPKYSPQHPILKHPKPTILPPCERPSFTPTQNNRNSRNTCEFYLRKTLESKQDAIVHLAAYRFSYPGLKMNISIAASSQRYNYPHWKFQTKICTQNARNILRFQKRSYSKVLGSVM